MKILIIIVITVLGVIVAASFTGGTRTTSAPKDTPATQVSVKDTSDKLAAGMKQNYIDGCFDGTNKAYCECTYKGLDRIYTNTEFIQYAIDIDTGKITVDSLPPEVWEIIIECYDE